MQYLDRANAGVKALSPYQAGKPIEELERELGIKNIIKLASNENPFGLPPSAKNAIQAQLGNLHLYPDSNGFYFKQAVAEKFGLQPEQITLGNGSNDLIELIAHTFASEQDEVIYSQYGFIVYPLISQALNAKRVETPAKNYGNDLAAFLNAITPKTKLIYLANSSAVEIADFLAQVPPQVIVALDEAYVEFTEPSERVDSFGLLAKYPNLIVCRTLSKAYGLAGLRIGYAVSSTEIAGLLNRVRQPFNCNSLALAAATAAIQDDEFVAKVAENNRIGLQLLQNFFDEKGLRYVPSKGNFVMLDLQQPAAPIYQALLRKGVIVRPLAGYGLPNHLRISIGLPEENQRFLTALSDILGL